MPADAHAARLAERVEFVNENDARRMFARLLEQIADARRADADEHFHEIRAAHAEKWHFRFSGNRPRKERFARSRRADEQDAFWNFAAEPLKFLRRFQKFHDFLQFFFGLVNSGDIIKRDASFVFRKDFRLAFAERHHRAARPHAFKEPLPNQKKEAERNHPGQNRADQPVFIFPRIINALRVQLLDKLRVFDADREKFFAVFKFPANQLRHDEHILDVAARQLFLEFAVRNALNRSGHEQLLDERHHEKDDNHVPNREMRPFRKFSFFLLRARVVADVQLFANPFFQVKIARILLCFRHNFPP